MNPLRFIFASLLLCVFALSSQAEIIPSSRVVVWQNNVGVNGGIPTRTTIAATLSPIGSGSDDQPQIQSALDAAISSDQVVKLNAGTFILNSKITMPDLGHVVLRGAGSNTVLVANFADDIVKFYGRFYAWTQTNIVSACSKGSSNIVLVGMPDAGSLLVGSKVQINEDNDTALVIGTGIEGGPFTRCVGQWVEVTSKSGNTITVWPPLFIDYNTNFTPRIRWPINGALPAQNFCEYAGLEDFVISNRNDSAAANVSMSFTGNCWLKNVTSKNGAQMHINLLDTFRIEIRDSLISGALDPITSSRGYGISMGTPNSTDPTSKPSSCLIENNIFERCRGSMVIGYGASGNVIGYNYFSNTTNESPTILRSDIIFHSSFPLMNLVEGNVGWKLNADNFHGPSALNTIFRNHFAGKYDATTVSSLSSIELDQYQRTYNAVGNVLGYDGIVATVLALTSPAGTTNYSDEAPAASAYGNRYKVWMLNYLGEGGDTSGTDTNVTYTLLRHGNYDYVTTSIKWDSGIADHTLPDSYYLSSQPSWWTGGWPFKGAALTSLTQSNQAQIRYWGVTTPSPSTPKYLNLIIR